MFRNHQRIATHLISIFEDMPIGHPNTLPMLSQEVRSVILMYHEFYRREDFQKAVRAILLLASLMHEVP